MIKFETTTTGNTLKAQFETYLKDVGVIVTNVLEQSEAPLIQAVSEYPRPAVHPFQFATPKSRRYYFYLISIGKVNTDGKRYIRSGGYKNAWSTQVTSGQNVYRLSLMNKWRASRYVGGDLTFDKALMARPQVAGHRVTGWQLSASRASAEFDNTLDRLRDALRKMGAQ